MRPRLPASPMIRVAVLTAAVAASLPVGTAFAQSAARVWPAMKTPPPCTAASTQAWLGLGAGGGHAARWKCRWSSPTPDGRRAR